MGVAVLTGRDTCYAVAQQTGCRACYLACAVKGKAIIMERRNAEGRGYFEPTVHNGRVRGECAPLGTRYSKRLPDQSTARMNRTI